MIVLAVLSFVLIAEGYHLYDEPPTPMRNHIFTRMCEQNGEANNIIAIAGHNYLRCLDYNVGIEKFFNEYAEAKMNHSYDALFEKYCAKTPVLKACHNKLLDGMSPCIPDSETAVPITKKILDETLDLMCAGDGYTISRFFTEDGPQCLEEKSQDLFTCVNNLQESMMYRNYNPQFSSQSEHVYENALSCILDTLETCNNSVPAIIFKRIIDIIHQKTEVKRLRFGIVSPVNNERHAENAAAIDSLLNNLCKKNGVDFNAVKAVGAQSIMCMENQFGVTMLDRELQEADENGSYAQVFRRYCPIMPLLKTCIHNLIHSVSPCFGNESEAYLKTTKTAYDGFLDFICQDDGYTISRFFVEGGPQCLKDKHNDIRRCAQSSKNVFIRERTMTLSVTQLYGVDDEFLHCVLSSLKTCNRPEAFKKIVTVAGIIRRSISHQDTNSTGMYRASNTALQLNNTIFKAIGSLTAAFNLTIFFPRNNLR